MCGDGMAPPHPHAHVRVRLPACLRAAAFPFFYIEPAMKEHIPIVAKVVGPVTRADTEHIAPIGNAPTMMTLEQMKAVMPLFFNLSIAVHNDAEAAKEWGWVQVRRAWRAAVSVSGGARVA